MFDPPFPCAHTTSANGSSVHVRRFFHCRRPSPVLHRRSQGLGELIPEQVLNILWQGDSDQTPAPLQQPKRKTEALLLRQHGRRRHFEPGKAIFRISKNLPNGANRALCDPDRARRWIGTHGYRPTITNQLGQCFGGNQFLHDWIGDPQGAGGHALRERTDVDSGPPNVGGHDLLRERRTHRIEIHMTRHCADIMGLHGVYEHQQVIERPGSVADPDKNQDYDSRYRLAHELFPPPVSHEAPSRAPVAEPSFAGSVRLTFSPARKKCCRSPRYRRQTGAGPRSSCAADMAACSTAPPAPAPPWVRSGAGRSRTR